MNVLILSAAAKVLLVRSFQAAVAEFGGRVIAADLARDNAALFAADIGVLLPRSDDPTFAEALEGVVKVHQVRLIVPTRDAEIAVLAGLKSRFAAIGATILAPSPETLAIVQDKRRFVTFCASNGFPVARVFESNEKPQRFPVFVRPARGAGGRGAGAIVDVAAWTALGAERAGLVIQDMIEAPEYTIDVLLDLRGRPIEAVTRRRLMVRDGEAVKSRVENQPKLRDASLALSEALGLVGHNVVQAFVLENGDLRFVEVNPRFGGASNLSIAAGLDSPRRIVELLSGRADAARRERPIRFGLTMLRYSDDVLVPEAEFAAMERVQ